MNHIPKPNRYAMLATTEWADEHVATCTDDYCWLCFTYQRTDPLGFLAAIKRHEGKFN